MKNLKYESLVDFSEAIIDVYGMLDEFGDVSVIAKYEEARALLSILAIDFDIVSAEIDYPEGNGYDDEYVLSINGDGLWIEPFKKEGKYITDDSVVTFVLDNCSSTCLPHCESHLLFEVAIDEMDEECEEIECEGCPYGECGCHVEPSDEELEELKKLNEFEEFDDEDIHGFTASCNSEDGYRYVSFHTTENLDKEEMIEIAKKFGIGI